MRADFAVVLDACVLVESAVSDLFLRLAEEPRLFLPKWTEPIWDETYRTWVEKLGWKPDVASRRRAAATEFFPEAMISGFESIVALCENDPKDRHVLAAAVHAKVEVIVTFNVRHFRPEALDPWNVAAVRPGDYLVTLYEHDPVVVADNVHRLAADADKSFEEMLGRLAWAVPSFTERLGDGLRLEIPVVNSGDWRRLDWYRDSYFGQPDRNPTGPDFGTMHVLRGGSWFYDQTGYFRSANRIKSVPDNQHGDRGFRLAGPS